MKSAKPALLLLLLVILTPSLRADISNRCGPLFTQSIISDLDRPHLPILFEDSANDGSTIEIIETMFNKISSWNRSLGPVQILKIADLKGDDGAYVQIEFKFAGVALHTQLRAYYKIMSRPSTSFTSITGTAQIRWFQPVANTLEMDLPLSSFKEPSPVQYQINQDLVLIASELIKQIPDSVFKETGTSRDELNRELKLQYRGMFLVNSPFNQNGENPAYWVLSQYINKLPVTLPTF